MPEVKYSCIHCKLEFTTNFSLLRHLKIHNKNVEENKISHECEIYKKSGQGLGGKFNWPSIKFILKEE